MHLKKRQYQVSNLYKEDSIWLYSPSRFRPLTLWSPPASDMSVSQDWRAWLMDSILGIPEVQFIYERDGLLIAMNGDRWQVKHGYLEKTYQDGLREDITQPITLILNVLDPDEAFFVCPSVIFKKSYIDLIETHQAEEGNW